MSFPFASRNSLRYRLANNPISRGAMLVGGFALVVFFLTRLVILCTLARGSIGWDLSLVKALGIGAAFDVLTAFYVSLVWVALSALVASRRLGLWRLVFLAAILWGVWYLVHAQGPIATGVAAAILASPMLCTFGRPSGRVFTVIVVGIFVAALLFGAVAEWYFWQEFGARFNFIAVDYLVYTQEVLANIRESYPLPVIVTALALATGAVLIFFRKMGWLLRISDAPFNWKSRLAPLTSAAMLFFLTVWMFSQSQLPLFSNNYDAELAKNGLYSFGAAFFGDKIDYPVFYATHPIEESLAGAQKLLATPAAPIASSEPGDLRRAIKHEGAEKKWNVILVCVESLSGEYLGVLGNKRGLTPNLDRIAGEGLFFRNLYATGTRTIRGMEALTLSVPPTPGQSLLRSDEATDLFSLGSLFGERGYDCAFLYGGNGLFDNMNYFFRHNGYRIVDAPTKSAADFTFQNAWGACDGDMFRWTVQEADRAYAQGKPFHYYCMTTSNHRPFTFPEQGLDLRDSTGAVLDDGPKRTVKYTDHAIHQLLEIAKTKPWFPQTIFVIVADHCAFSAGKADLDVTKFHIPAIIWNPTLVQPNVCKELCSQIDVMPTLFGLMNWSYTTRFFGQDVFDPGYNSSTRRAFVSNYQKVGLLRDETLAILKPKKECGLYQVSLKEGTLTPDPSLSTLREEAINFYQSAAHLFKSGRLKKDVSQP